MKLKYYLRGLGIGIIVTTLILMIAYHLTDSVSDTEVIERAKKLGMIMPETTSDQLFTKPDETDETTSNEEQNETTDSSTTTEESTISEPVIEEPTTEAPTTEAPTTEAPTTEAPTTEAPTTTVPPVAYTLTIRGGMYSEAVSAVLEREQIVDSATAFNDYLCSHGYEAQIMTGTYTLSSDMSYEEIAKKITGR